MEKAIIADVATSGNYEYTILADGTVEITKYNGNETDVAIPSEIDSHPVTCIGEKAFYWCSSLTSVTIPDSVTSIRKCAFCRCKSLTGITIPDGVTSIGYCVFCNCKSLTSVIIPDSVTSIGFGAFEGCTSLTSVTIGNSVTSIAYSAFEDCTSLTSVTIPDGVTSIGDWAFNYCSSLTSITIPDSVTSIGFKAFSNCYSLTSITIPDSTTSIGDRAFGYYYEKYSTCKIEGFTISGHKGSAAEQYADENGFTFICICDHKPVTVKGRPATCTRTGLTAGKKCSVCGGVAVKQKAIARTRHSVVTVGKKVYTYKFKTAKSVTKTVSKLKKGKYTVYVRAYKQSGKTYAYSPTVKQTVTVK